ncbi:neurofilament heavy polypeptide-like [Panicum miliaceum]|uniref:Neurofilament heavy polypeptide-like n=1 Tax=Panicum miliaceum TaxID=4540 RepID=A0A3L6SUH2_PANMI|nr:neurofilament heavy polypeptide-like [Panicum miliaceum]
MDSADVAAPFGAWASIRGYFTPATLFLVVNLVIGTIALTSRATQQRRRREHHHYHDDGHGHYHLQEPLHPHQQPTYGDHYYQQPEQQILYATPPAPAPLARTSSVLDRLRSFGLYRFRSGDFPPEYGAAAGPNHAQDAFAPVEEETATEQAHYARSQPEPAPAREERRSAARVRKSGAEVRKAQAVRAPARVVEAVAEDDSVDARAEEFTASFRREPSPLQQEYNYQEEYVPPPARVRAPAPAPLARTSSVMDRLRSLGLYGFLAPEQPAAASIPANAPAAAVEKKQAQSHYDRSRSEPAWEQGSNKERKPEAKSKMAKSSSETRKAAAPSRVEEALAGESVDARAEAFIDSFKQQQAQHHREDEYVPPPAPAPLSRAPSVLERLRSFSLYRFRSGDLGPDLPAAAAKSTPPAADEKKQAAAHYGRSRSEPAREQGKKEPRMSKSSSVVAEEEPAAEADQGVDARADDFINKFRQQLHLQRLNSLLNYKSPARTEEEIEEFPFRHAGIG